MDLIRSGATSTTNGDQAMKRQVLRNAFDRMLHDASCSIRGIPAFIDDAKDLKVEQAPLLQGGTVSVSLEDENQFYGDTLPPSVTRWRSVSLYRLQDARVVGDQGSVFTEEGKLLRICPSLKRMDLAKVRRPIPWLARRMRGSAFHLTGRDHENHGHFLMQHLPRLMAARLFLEKQGLEPEILVAPGHEKWQGRYLSALKIDAQRIVPCSTGTVHIDDLLYVPMLWDSGHLGPPDLYAQMQSCFRHLGGVMEGVTPKGRPLFVSRSDAPTRRLSNETEIINMCRQLLGEIDVINLREVPLIEQIRRFAEAPLVIGPQGQGLTSIAFAANCRMLILEAGQSPRESGWASTYRDFAHFTGNSALRMLSGEPWPNDGDWEFPPAFFAQQLRRVISLGLHLHRPSVLF